MKTIILMRHGEYLGTNLTKSGQTQVDAAAEASVNDNLIPDVIVHSPVVRAVETAQRVQAVFARVSGRTIPLVCNRALAVGSTEVDRLTPGIPAEAATALVVTHQPNVEDLSDQFGKYCSPGTAEMNVFQTETANWADVRKAAFVRRVGG